MNCDGRTNGLDVQPFVTAVLDPVAYSQEYPGCNAAHGDMNGDNLVNALDTALFAAATLEP